MPGATAGLSVKSAERSATDYSLMAEQVLQQLQQLPPVTLQEPEVRINYAVWPMLGSSVFSGEFLYSIDIMLKTIPYKCKYHVRGAEECIFE